MPTTRLVLPPSGMGQTIRRTPTLSIYVYCALYTLHIDFEQGNDRPNCCALGVRGSADRNERPQRRGASGGGPTVSPARLRFLMAECRNGGRQRRVQGFTAATIPYQAPSIRSDRSLTNRLRWPQGRSSPLGRGAIS